MSFHYLPFRNEGIIGGRFHYHLSSVEIIDLLVNCPHDCRSAASWKFILGIVAEFTKQGDEILGQTNDGWTMKTKEGVEDFSKSFMITRIFANEDGTEALRLERFWMSLTVVDINFWRHLHIPCLLRPPHPWEGTWGKCLNNSLLLVPFPLHHLHQRLFLWTIVGSVWYLRSCSLHTSIICRLAVQYCYFLIRIDHLFPIVQPTSELAIPDPVSFHISPRIDQGSYHTFRILLDCPMLEREPDPYPILEKYSSHQDRYW